MMKNDKVGIDVSDLTLEASLLIQGSHQVRTFSNTPAGWSALEAWLDQAGVVPAHICLEATGRYWLGVARHLHHRGHRVSVINPAQIKPFSRARLTRNKTDRVDCAQIRQFAEAFDPAPWSPPPQALEDLRDVLGTRDQVVTMITALTNRLGCSDRDPAAQASEQRLLEALRRELAQLEAVIAKTLQQDSKLQANYDLLISIPGVGPQLAAVILAELPGPEILHHAAATAYAGLNPAHCRSGQLVRATPISKIGNTVLRKALYMPALAAMRFNPLIHAFAGRLRATTRLAKKQIVMAAMRKLLALCFGVLKTRKPFDSDYLHTPQPVAS